MDLISTGVSGDRHSAKALIGLLCSGILLSLQAGRVATAQIAPKPATSFTADLNARVYETLDFSSRQDFDNATQGFIVGLESPRYIYNDNLEMNNLGFFAWNLEEYFGFMDNAPAPRSANPSL